jgi:REP-associated tyrosine transposase
MRSTAQALDPHRGRVANYRDAVRHTFVWVRVHLVWSTYRRRRWIARSWQEHLYRRLAITARRKGAIVLAAGGAPDHVHVYVSLASHTSVSHLVDALKANSSRWIHDVFPQLKLFAWQKGYSAFSVCRRCEQRVIAYIRNQEARHGPAREGGVDGPRARIRSRSGPSGRGGQTSSAHPEPQWPVRAGWTEPGLDLPVHPGAGQPETIAPFPVA